MPEKDAVAEAKSLAVEAKNRGVTLRLLGGIAFRLRCPSSIQDNLKRNYVDIDFVGLRKDRKGIQTLFVEKGYAPRTTFNAMNGYKRLIFNDIENERRVDIFLNEFEMCHKLDFTNRLKLDEITLPLSDLLLTKLQVYEITEREYRDVIAFFRDQKLGEKDGPDTFNAKYIAKLCSGDWGLYRTISLNLERVSSALPNYIVSESERVAVKSKIDELAKIIEAEPKSFGWKMRARIGDKVKWYELPEADREVVDSRPTDERVPAKQDQK
ncbi:MAG TPA: hypothetical protein VJN71_03160 [Nitrososphaerales archaeon]|nr:hypothetical protein [Nitrososphaerales archaeon]